MSSRPIIIVTGANSGVGFGICERFLHQFASATPPDVELLRIPSSSATPLDTPLPCEGLTLIMACRNLGRAEAARKRLSHSLDAHILARVEKGESVEHAKKFRASLQIDICLVDLGSIASVFNFVDEISENYPYISHLICNAGFGSYLRVDLWWLLHQIFTDPVNIIYRPSYARYVTGERTSDGLGTVFQANLFSHYVMSRALTHKFNYIHGSKVIWTSSMNAFATGFDAEDCELVKAQHPYELVKFEIQLLAAVLDQQALERGGVRHLVMHPGICRTEIASALVHPALAIFHTPVQYFGRFIGLKYIVVTPYAAAAAAVSSILAPLSALRTDVPRIFEVMNNPLGKLRVEVNPIEFLPEHEENARVIAKHCDALYEQLVDVHQR